MLPPMLNAATRSNNNEMVEYFLEKGGFPTRKKDGEWDGDISSISSVMKNAIANAFIVALRNTMFKVVPFLWTYRNLHLPLQADVRRRRGIPNREAKRSEKQRLERRILLRREEMDA